MKKTLLVIPLVFLLSGCICYNWLVNNNPNTPSVRPPNGKPNNWPVFKGTNQIDTVTNNINAKQK